MTYGQVSRSNSQTSNATSTQSIGHGTIVPVHDKANDIDTQRMTAGEIVWVPRPHKVHLLQRAHRWWSGAPSSVCSRASVLLPTSALQCQRASPSLAAAGCLAWRVLPAYMSASSLKAFILRNEVVGLYRNFLKAVRKAPEHIRGMSWLRS